MKITIEFNSLEEFDSFRGTQTTGEIGYLKPLPCVNVPTNEPEPAMVDAYSLEPEPVKVEANSSEPAPVEKEEPALIDEEPTFIQDIPEDEPAPEAEVDYELLRLETRKVLAELNRTVSGKPAQNLIKAMGYKGLTEVPGERLQELKVTAQKMLEGVTA